MTHSVSGFWLCPTYECNNRCIWCFVGGKLSCKETMPLEDARRYASLLAEAGAKRCILVGGEPTVYPHLFELIHFMRNSLSLDVRLMSNGRKLSDRSFVRELKKNGVQWISVSTEGPRRIHDEITQEPGSFEQAMRGIQNCLLENVPVNSITTVGAPNLGHIDELAKYLSRFPLRKMVFNMCSSQPSGYQVGIDRGTISLEEYARTVEDVGLAHDNVRFYALIPLCIFDQQKMMELISKKRLTTACALLSNVVTIDPKGNMLPCTHMAGLSYANLNQPNAIDIFRKQKEKEIPYLKSHAPSSKCVKCKLWKMCHGGCNLVWFSRSASQHVVGLKEQAKTANPVPC